MEDCGKAEAAVASVNEAAFRRGGGPTEAAGGCGLTCSAGVGLRSWFLFSRHSLKEVSSGGGFTLGKAISHW